MRPKTTDEFYNQLKQREQQELREQYLYLRQCLFDLNLQKQLHEDLGSDVVASLEDEEEGPHADMTETMRTDLVAQLI